MPENKTSELTFTAEELAGNIDEETINLDTGDDSPVVVYVNGKFYPIISIEADDEEGRIVLNIGTQEVKSES